MWSIATPGNEIRYRVISRLLSRRPAPAASQPRPYAVETDKPPKTHRCSGRSGFTSADESPTRCSGVRADFRSNPACGSPPRSTCAALVVCLIQSGHLDVPGPVGGPEWRWGVEVCTAEEDDIHRNVVGGQLYYPAKFW